jgi:hypothetical protein
MKSQEFSSFLRSFAHVLAIAGAQVAHDQIIMFSTIFDADPKLSVSALAKRISSLNDPGPANSRSLGDVRQLLSALEALFANAAKSSVLADIEIVEQLLRDRASMELSTFVRLAIELAAPRCSSRKPAAAKVRNDLIDHYKTKLEESLGDEENFTAVYNDLRANSAVGKGEIVTLAKQMTGSGARTEDAALKKIWNRHRSLMVFKAKSRVTSGRSAA